MEQAALAAAYGLAHGKLWDWIVALLAERAHVNCVAFQAVKGVALDFATRMRWVRGGRALRRGARRHLLRDPDRGSQAFLRRDRRYRGICRDDLPPLPPRSGSARSR